MTDENQIVVPRSFIDLFVPPGRIKPTEPYQQILTRYELCEDLAQMLTETASAQLFDLGLAQSDVLERIHAGLTEADLVDQAEAQWVVRRLAELQGWEPFDPDRGEQ
jgi:hypothetical protein